MSTSFLAVHLSDIHFGQERGDGRIHEDARDELLDDARRLRGQLGDADAIIVTGDIAFSGKGDQYDRAGEWLSVLAECVGCKEENVLVIPGNHDVDRAKISSIVKLLHDNVSDADPGHLNDQLQDLSEDDNACAMLLRKLLGYQEFASRYGKAFASFNQPYWLHDIRLDSHTVRFVGLNTVLFSGSDHDKGRLTLGPIQFVLPREPGVSYVALLHHPFDWLKDGVRARQYIASRSLVCLLGHEHSLRIERATLADGPGCLMINAGATNPPVSQGYEFRYNWLRFEPGGAPEERTLSLSIWPRVWVMNATRFEPDAALLSGMEAEVYQLALSSPDAVLESEDSATEAETATSRPDVLPIEALEVPAPPNNEEVVSQEDPRFRRLQFLFWKKLKPNDRLRVLLTQGVLPEMEYRTSVHWLRHGLESARAAGRLHALWQQIMSLIPAHDREPNPFPSSQEDRHT